MASEHDHLTLANKNHDALMVLIPIGQEHPEWVATIAFYKAVQIIEAVLVKTKHGPSSSHQDRNFSLRCKLKDKELHGHYAALLNTSKVARYLHDSHGKGFKSFVDHIPADKLVKRVIKGRLIPVEQLAKKYLSDNGKKLLKVTDAILP